MSDSTCDVCGSPMGAGGGGGGGSDVAALLAAHLADFGDPHRTLPQAPKSYYGIADPVADSSAYKPGDFYFDLASGRGYSFRMVTAADGDDPAVYEWARIITPYAGIIDLSAYLLSSVAASTYVTKEYAAAHYLTSASLDGYVTSGSLSSALAGYVTTSALSAALSSSGYITQAFADSRYQRVASAGDVFVSASDLAAALAGYTPTANLATVLSLSDYLTITAADSNSGFIRKSDVSTYLSGYVTSAALATALAGYVTPGYLSANGYLTQALGDARYVRIPDSSEYALKSYIDAKLADYKKTSELAGYLGLSGYLTKAEAAGANGYIPKSSAGSLGYATQAWVTGQLANYVARSGLPEVQAAIQAAVAGYADGRYATRDQLAQTAQAVGGVVLAEPVDDEDTGEYVLHDHAHNLIDLTDPGYGGALYVRIPPRPPGNLARDFSLVVTFNQDPHIGFFQDSLVVRPTQAEDDLPAAHYFSYTDNAFELDLSGAMLSATMAVFCFTEVAVGRFLVSSRLAVAPELEQESVP